MIISKTTYETSDGKSFDTEQEAKKHEESLENGTYFFILVEEDVSSYVSILFASDSYSKILEKKEEYEKDESREYDNYSYSIRKVTKI